MHRLYSFVIAITTTFFGNISAQVVKGRTTNLDSALKDHVPEMEFVASNFPSYKSFMFRRVNQQYITNENNYLLDVRLDTAFILAERSMDDTSIFSLRYSQDIEGKQALKKGSDLEKMTLKIRLDVAGKIKELVNWTDFRDYFVSALSREVQNELITSAMFKKKKDLLNSEKVIRWLVMEDLIYMFDIYGDSVDLNLKYLRLKNVKSPFTNKKVPVMGDLSITRTDGAANTLFFKAQNKADAELKKQLLQEAQQYLKIKNGDRGTVSEITSVGLNSEQELYYNSNSKCLMRAVFSDVLAINLQSRGNIRTYQLWDYLYSWE